MKIRFIYKVGVILVAILVISSTLLIGCAGEKAVTGGTLKIAVTTVGKSLYPPNMTTVLEHFAAQPCLESLVYYDNAGNTVAGLATEWDIETDPPSVTFTLREGVKFHDGTDFDAEAAKWNLDQYNAAGRAELQIVDSIDILDEYTIRLNLTEFRNDLLNNLSYVSGHMVSPQAYEDYGEDGIDTHPVGTGPFKFVEWERDVELIYEKNEDYWQEGKPFLDRIEIIEIADPMVAYASLLNGEVDILSMVAPNDAAELADDENFNIVSKSLGWRGIMGPSDKAESPFSDVLVRQAMSYAIDKEAIADALYYGYATPIHQFTSEDSVYWNPDVEDYPYDPDMARELMAEAGHSDGFDTTIICINTPIEVQLHTVVQSYLAAIGINATIDASDMGRIFQIVVGGDWDGLLTVPVSQPTPNFDRTCSIHFVSDAPLFVHQIFPEDFEQAVQEALSTPDPQVKIEKNHEIMELFIDEYCIVTGIIGLESMTASSVNIHDHNIYGRTLEGTWTPADCWKE